MVGDCAACRRAQRGETDLLFLLAHQRPADMDMPSSNLTQKRDQRQALSWKKSCPYWRFSLINRKNRSFRSILLKAKLMLPKKTGGTGRLVHSRRYS